MPVHYGRNEGIGWRGENGTLQPPGEQGHKRAVYTTKEVWGQIKLTQKVIEMTKTNKAAAVEAFKSEVTGMIKDIAEDRDRVYWGDGTGKLATLGVTTASTTVTCTDTKFVRVGMRVDILTISTGAAVATDRKVTAVTKNASFVIDGAAVTTAATDGVYRAGDKVLTTNNSANGIQSLVDDTGAFGGLNPATAGEEFWASDDRGTIGTIAEEEMERSYHAPNENGFSSSDNRVIFADYPSFREFGRVLTTLKKYDIRPATTPQLSGGYKALDFLGTDVLPERKCAAGTMFFLDREGLDLLQLADPGWKEKDGRILKDDGGTGYVGRYFSFENLGTNARWAHSVMRGITAAP